MEHFVKTPYVSIRLLKCDMSMERVVVVVLMFMLLNIFMGRFQDGGRGDGYLVGVGNLLGKLGFNHYYLLEPTFLETRLWRGRGRLATPPEE